MALSGTTQAASLRTNADADVASSSDSPERMLKRIEDERQAVLQMLKDLLLLFEKVWEEQPPPRCPFGITRSQPKDGHLQLPHAANGHLNGSGSPRIDQVASRDDGECSSSLSHQDHGLPLPSVNPDPDPPSENKTSPTLVGIIAPRLQANAWTPADTEDSECKKSDIPKLAKRVNWGSCEDVAHEDESLRRLSTMRISRLSNQSVAGTGWLGLEHVIRRGSQVLEFWNQKTRRDQKAQNWQLLKFVKSTPFQVVCSCAILANAVFVGWCADVLLKLQMEGREEDSAMKVLELCFCIWFALELSIRCAAEQWLFLFGEEWRWNLLDSVLVLMSVLDIVLNGLKGSTSGASVGRLLRLVRFARIMRLARVIRSFQSFRLLVFSILESFGSLFWCFLVVLFLLYAFAILFLYGIAEHVREGMAEVDTTLTNLYGGLWPTMRSLFMAISGGMDWTDTLAPLKSISWVFEPFFSLYIFFMYFGVLNVVVGAFVATTADIASKDRRALIKTEMSRLKSYAKKIKQFFEEADVDNSGNLSWEEFENHLHTDEVQAYFQALELDVSHAKVLFRLMDSDDSDQVGLDEFLEGCMRLKGTAKSVDVNMLLYENEKVFGKLLEFMDFAQDRFDQIENKLGIPERRVVYSGGSTRGSNRSSRCRDLLIESPGSRLAHAMNLCATVE